MAPPLLQVCAFESRRRAEMARLIERAHGVPTVVASMREIPLSDHTAVFHFADKLLAGEVQVIVFMTGVGAEVLVAALEESHRFESVKQALAEQVVAARGPKPAAALSRFKIAVNVRAPEPNTWADMARELERQGIELSGVTVAVQEYGEPSRSFYAWLEQKGAAVLPVPVYRWGLPEELGPLQEAVQATVAGQFQVLLWTSAQQVNHMIQVAQQLGLEADWKAAANRCVQGSIGPTCSERLTFLGVKPDLEPSHPKMAHLVRETLEQAPAILARKCQSC